jgi:hypothetical protein
VLAGIGVDAQAVSKRALVIKPRLRRVRNWAMLCFLWVRKFH